MPRRRDKKGRYLPNDPYFLEGKIPYLATLDQREEVILDQEGDFTDPNAHIVIALDYNTHLFRKHAKFDYFGGGLKSKTLWDTFAWTDRPVHLVIEHEDLEHIYTLFNPFDFLYPLGRLNKNDFYDAVMEVMSSVVLQNKS